MKPAADTKKLGVLSLAIMLAVLPCAPSSLPDQTNGEYQVKAAFLFHFAQFVEWPAETFPSANSPLKYCTIGDDPFRGALDETLKNKTVGTRPLLVQHLTNPEQIAGCQILFIATTEKKQFGAALSKAGGHPVLSVGETEHFTSDGGMIGLFLEDNKVRFDINLQAAERSKLKISSRLLLLAKNVIGNHE
jgi:uncharacterized protein DUF4154